MIVDDLKEMGIKALMDSPYGENLLLAYEQYKKAQEVMYAIEDADDKKLLNQKIGTVLTLSMLKIMASGKQPSDFTNEDVFQIANTVADYAILPDGQIYMKFVFELYAQYIEAAATILDNAGVDERKVNAILNQAATIRDLTESLDEGIITETEYIEKCLWICLEAIIKMMSAQLTSKIGEEFGGLAEAVSMYAFEYGRLSLYKEEQALLDESLLHQEKLDQELQMKFDAYVYELEKKYETINELIDNAFDPDFEEKFENTMTKAREAGVAEEDVLDTVEKIDEFFM